MSELGRTVDWLGRQDELILVYLIFAATLALILLFFVARLVRNVVAARVRQIGVFGMDFDAVAEMLDKGLLTADEAKRVKAVLTRHFSKLYERQETGKQADALLSDAPTDAIPRGEKIKPVPPSPEGGAGIPAAAGATSTSARPPATIVGRPDILVGQGGRDRSVQPTEVQPDEVEVELPLDILDMYQAGMITREEFAALRHFYAAKAQRRQ